MTETTKKKTVPKTQQNNGCEECLSEIKKIVKRGIYAVGIIGILTAISFNTISIEKCKKDIKNIKTDIAEIVREKLEMKKDIRKLNTTVFNITD